MTTPRAHTGNICRPRSPEFIMTYRVGKALDPNLTERAPHWRADTFEEAARCDWHGSERWWGARVVDQDGNVLAVRKAEPATWSWKDFFWIAARLLFAFGRATKSTGSGDRYAFEPQHKIRCRAVETS